MAALLLVALPAAAHKVNVFGYVEGGMIQGEGYFPGGGKAKNSKVELVDSSGKVLASTTTDAKGSFKLELPQAKPPLKLVLTASMGHKGEYMLTAADLGQTSPAVSMVKGKKTGQEPERANDQSNTATVSLDEKQLKEIVNKALEEKLAPLQAQIARMTAERAVGVADIVGGLGYILGLLGLAAYLNSRKKK
jgi:nickel transport protein